MATAAKIPNPAQVKQAAILRSAGVTPKQMSGVQGLGRNALSNEWLTINSQGNDSATGEGDGAGSTTDWGKMLQPDFEGAQKLGYTGNVPEIQSGDTSNQMGNPKEELLNWMKSSGYTTGIIPTFNGGQVNAWLDPSGKEIAGTRKEVAAPDDGAFWLAANLAGAFIAGPQVAGAGGGASTGISSALKQGGMNAMSAAAQGAKGSQIGKSFVTGAAGNALGQFVPKLDLGPVASGALVSGATSALTGGSGKDILTNAVIGGTMGGVKGSELVSGLDAPMKNAVTGGLARLLKTGDPRAALMSAIMGSAKGNPAAQVAIAAMLRSGRKP